MPYFLGVDNGGTFVKAGVVDENGTVFSVAKEAVKNTNPRPGHTQRDMEELWKQNAAVMKAAVEKSGIRPEEITAVSFSGHGKGLYLVDQKGNPVYPGILSTDNRAIQYSEGWKQDGTADKVFEKTFQEILACQPVSLLAWLKDHEPAVYQNIRYIFSVKDYIRYRLTGEAYGEYSDFSGANLINLNTFTYDRELLALFGVEDCFDKLPPLKYSFDICGYVTENTAEETSLVENTPVCAGMFDVDACGLAAGLAEEEALCMIAGTWSINEYIRKNPVTDGSVALNSMYCIPGYFLIEESSPTSAGNMQWFMNHLMPDIDGEHKYRQVNDMVESIEPEDCRVIFLPFLYGSNDDARAKGSFIGLTEFHHREHMLRSVYEGIVFSHVTHVKRLLRNRQKPTAVRLAGGAANSEVWVQIFADALQMPVEVVTCKEQGILGAAMAAAVGTGFYREYEDAARGMVQVSGIVMPRKEYGKIYAEKYQCYQRVIKSLAGVWQHFD